jgi:putative membrane protein
VQKALSGGMMEVELGNLASSKAQNPRVKNFGSMMVTDHSAAGNELKQMATSNNIAVQGNMLPEHQGHVDMLKNKSGAAFDKAYMDMMVKDHKKDIDEYKKAANNLSVSQYKMFASKTLPVLQKHLDSAQAIHKNM